MTDPAYQLNPDHPAHHGKPGEADRQLAANAAIRDMALVRPEASEPLADKVVPEPVSEVERLFPDQDRVARAREVLQIVSPG